MSTISSSLFFMLFLPLSIAAYAEDGRRLEDSFRALAVAADPNPLPASAKPSTYTARLTRKGRFLPRGASSCGTVNFAESMGDNRNQDGLNWCFGSVAADVLSHELGYRVSDFDLSLRTFASQSPKKGKKSSVADLSVGSVSAAVSAGIQGGVCSEENMPANDRVLGRLADEMERKGYKLTAKELEETGATMLVKAIQSMETVRGWSLERLLASESVSCDSYQYTSAMFPQADGAQIVAGLAGSPSNEDLFRWLISRNCERQPVKLAAGMRFKHFLPPSGLGSTPKGFHLMPALDRRLDKSKPVVVGFRAKRFFVEEPDDVHAAIVVGREFRNGKCRYLIRNSYGSGCGQYKDPYGKKENCAGGNFWISEDDFHQTAEFIEMLE